MQTKKHLFNQHKNFFKLIFFGSIMIMIFAISIFGYNVTFNSRASNNQDSNYFINKYNNRVPGGQKLLSFSERQKTMTTQEITNAGSKVHIVANYPSLSGTNPEWKNSQTGEVVPKRNWVGIYEIFPDTDFDEIINSNLSASEVQYVLQKRKEAIELFMSRFYGSILNETYFSKYREEITHFADQISTANKVNDQLRAKYGIETDVLDQSPKIVALQVLGKAGYTNLDVLIDHNIDGVSGHQDESNWHIRRFQGLYDTGVKPMADAVRRVDAILKKTARNVSYRYIYMNEVDMIPCHTTDCGKLEGYFETKTLSPEEYATSYYKLAKELSTSQIVLVPSTFTYGLFGGYQENSNGINPWIEGFAKVQSQMNPNIGYDYLAANVYGNTNIILDRINVINNDIALVNRRYNTQLKFVRLQEIGLLPQQPTNREYDKNLAFRIKEMPTIIKRFANDDASIYAQTGLSLSPWDGKVPDKLLYGSTGFKHGFMYFDEPSLWSVVRDSLKDAVAPSQKGSPTNVSPQPKNSEPAANNPTSAPSTPESSNNVNCAGISAGVSNTCGSKAWRGCYCDTVGGKRLYVNSCGEQGKEEFKVTTVSCDSAPPANPGSGSKPSTPSNSSNTCTTNAPNAQIAAEKDYPNAIKNLCFLTDNNGTYKQCNANGQVIEGKTCEWCFGGYCMIKQ